MPGIGKRPDALIEGAEATVYALPVVIRVMIPPVTVVGGTAPAVVATPAIARFHVPTPTVLLDLTAMAYLVEGTTVRATFSRAPTSAVAPYEFVLSSGVISSITDWSNVRLRTRLALAGTGRYRLTQAELELGVTAAVQSVNTTPAVATFVVPNITKGQPPIAVIGSPVNGFSVAVGQPVTFDPIGTTDPEGAWQATWAFGDGSTFTGTMGNYASHVVQHAYAAAGPVTVTLTVVDEQGNQDVASISGTVTAAPSVPTAILITPSTLVSLYPGGTITMTGQVLDQFGNAMSGQVIGWVSGNTARATVAPATGASTVITVPAGATPGQVTVVASSPPGSGTVFANIAVTVEAAPTDWPNLPSGMTLIAENAYDTEPPGAAIYGTWGCTSPSLHSIVQVSGAPRSPSNVLDQLHYVGIEGGESAGIHYASWTAGRPANGWRRMYKATWFRTRDTSFEQAPLGHKWMMWGSAQLPASGGENCLRFEHGSDGIHTGAAQLVFVQQAFRFDLAPSSGTPGFVYPTHSKRISLGVWHLIEVLVQMNTLGQANGLLQVWVDGEVMYDKRDAVYKLPDGTYGGIYRSGFDHDFQGMKFESTATGTGAFTRSRDDHWQWDHTYCAASS